jgi:hypothetical protein
MVAAQEVLLALDAHGVAERRPEHLELAAAEPLTRRRRRADGAVVLDEDEVAPSTRTSASYPSRTAPRRGDAP